MNSANKSRDKRILYWGAISSLEMLGSVIGTMLVFRQLSGTGFSELSIKKFVFVIFELLLTGSLTFYATYLYKRSFSFTSFYPKLKLITRNYIAIFSAIAVYIGGVSLVLSENILGNYRLYFEILRPFLIICSLIVFQFWLLTWITNSWSVHQKIRNDLSLIWEKIVSSFKSWKAAISWDKNGRFKVLFWIFLILIGLGLFSSTIFRAATFPFTHDESISFASFTWQTIWTNDANNHLLNTWMIQMCSFLFGNSELALRLPNILAHGLYLASSLLIIKHFHRPVLQGIGFVFLNFNPFVNGFFSLARGYGLALAFELLGLCFLIYSLGQKSNLMKLTLIYFSSIAGFLSVLSNFAFLDLYLPLVLVCAWLILSNASLFEFHSSKVVESVIFLLTNSFLITFVVYRLILLNKAGNLYFGGNKGFIPDTLGSLIHNSIYSTPITEEIIAITVIGLFILIIILNIFLFLRKIRAPLLVILTTLLTASIALPVLQHSLIDVLFPIERSTLFYYPLYVLTLITSLEISSDSPYKILNSSILTFSFAIALLLFWNFFHNFNTNLIDTWGYDLHDKQVLKIIDQDRQRYFPGKQIKIGNSWQFEPTLNFYRITENYEWLSVVTRNPIDISSEEYIYAFKKDLTNMNLDTITLLDSFPDTSTVLLRINPVNQP